MSAVRALTLGRPGTYTFESPGDVSHTDLPVEVRTLFFAAYRELVGAAEVPVELPAGATVSELVATLRERGRPFDDLPSDPAVAVNRTYAEPGHVLEAGDEVAFIPPVAGG